jgi:hypothetical protein
MDDLVIFEQSRISYRGVPVWTGRHGGRDLILAPQETGGILPLSGGYQLGSFLAFPADYDNMLAWERLLAPAPRLSPLHSAARSGALPPGSFGAGNRMVISSLDGHDLREPMSFAGWDGIHGAMRRSRVPFWYVQQSIVRELIPEGVSQAEHPGIGHTGGYGPRELLRAGLFAFASQGGYGQPLPIGADADHAIVTGYDEQSLADSLALNKLAMSEARDYTKFTVDTSHLFGFPVQLGAADEARLCGAFRSREFEIASLLPGQASYRFRFDDDEVRALGRKYWQAAAVHKALYDHAASLCAGRPFDYELSLDETPSPTPPRELLFYLVLLYDVFGIPEGGVASAGPNIGFTKRHDFEGDLAWLGAQVNTCSSILAHFGAVLSVHSADGVRAATGKGMGVDAVLAKATGGACGLKVADVYQEVLWQVLASSPELAERAIFAEAWRRTYEAARRLAAIYASDLAAMQPALAQAFLASDAGRRQVAQRHGQEGLELAQGAIGYGLPLFKLAAELVPVTDPAQPDPQSELFRRFMFLTYRGLRADIFRTLDREGWQRLAAAIEEATMVRLRAMGWAEE